MNNFLKAILILAIFNTLISPARSLTNEDLREQAKILFLGNKLETANETILKIPESERNAEDYFIIGTTSTDPKTSIKAYEQAILKDKTFYQAYYNIGDIYLKSKNYEKAVEYLKKTIEAKKDFAYGYYNLGCAYLKLEEYDLARKSFEKAIKISPEEADYYYNLGYTHKKMGNTKRADKAINLYNELIKKRNQT